MALRKTLSALVTIAALCIIAPAQSYANTQGSADEVMLRAWTRAYDVTYVAVQMFRPFGDSSRFYQIKVEQLAGGPKRQTILQPLSEQNRIDVDDGTTWQSYYPDAERLVIAPSYRKFAPEPKKRIELAKQNYSLVIGESIEVAGRDTITVTAKPKSLELPEQTFCVDTKTSTILRVEVTGQDRKKARLVDTISALFPRTIAASRFKIETTAKTRTEKEPGPVEVTGMAQTKEVAGIQLNRVTVLPLGFRVWTTQIVGESGGQLIAFRFHDGIVNGTIYATKQTSEAAKMEAEVAKFKSGVRYFIYSNVQTSVLKKVLDGFVVEQP